MAKSTLWQWSSTNASNTDIGGTDITGTTGLVKNGDNAIREIMAQMAASEAKGADVASASTIALGTGRFFHITGTTTITDIDFTDAVNGRWAVLEFDGALTLTHNATTLTLPGGANITTAAGDRAFIVQDSGDNMHVLFYQAYAAATSYLPLSGGTLTGALNNAATQTIASGTTTDIGAATSNSVIISGTTTITGLGTVAAGVTREVLFSGALTLTHSGTALILPGSANITTAANDTAAFRSLGSGNWVCLWYKRASGNPITNTTKLAAIEALANASGALTNDGAGNFSYATSGSMTLLGTLTTTSGTTQSLTGIAAGYYQFYIEIEGVSFVSGSSQMTLALSSTNGAAYGTAQNIAPVIGGSSAAYQGYITIGMVSSTSQYQPANGHIVTGAPASAGSYSPTTTILQTNTAAVVNAVRFAGGSFDAGTIRIYGVK